MEDIPRGNTQLNVTKNVLKEISTLFPKKIFSMLDLPCGEGLFIDYVKAKYPQSMIVGVDLKPFASHQNLRKSLKFEYFDLSKGFDLNIKFNLITSISGIMEFENTGLFIENCHKHLEDNGFLVITNDNTITLRDRFSFLFFGKVRRFKLTSLPGQPTWKHVSIQELNRTLLCNNFKIIKIKYTSMRLGDWIGLPLALPFYLTQTLILLFDCNLSLKSRLKLFPLTSLMSRHYYIIAQK